MIDDEARVMPQDNERIFPYDPMCDMVNDAFGCHQYNNDMVDDREMSAKSSHILNDIGDFFELMQDDQESL